VTPFFGKYRGSVVDNVDPLRLGRLSVRVPDVFGDNLGWALPCVPFAGPGVGFLALPPVGANVWVEFEAGDPDYPVWAGCFWGPNQLPAEAVHPAFAVWRTAGSVIVLGRPEPAGGSREPLEVRMDDEAVVIGRGGRPFATVRDDAVSLEIPPLALRLAANEERLTLTCGTATITVAAGTIELSDGATSVTVTAEQVTAKGTTIDLSTVAGRIQVTPATVSINNGALEVI
jgi:hypothetical protein